MYTIIYMLQTETDRILKALFEVLPLLHRKLLRMDLDGVTGELTRLHLGIMVRLHQGNMKVSDLAKFTMVPISQITRLIDQLVEAGFVVRQPDPEDRRVINLVLTERGTDKFRDMTSKVQDGIKEKLSGLTPGELREMSEALESLRKIASRIQ